MRWALSSSSARPYSGVALARQSSLGIRSIHVPAGARAGTGTGAGAVAGAAAHPAWGAYTPVQTTYTKYGNLGGMPTTEVELEAHRRALDERIPK
jgi:hypothetical protein